MRDSVTWKIGGEAGFGIMSAGTMLARTHTRQGYRTFTTNEYPSLIRGGHNVVTVRIATYPVEAMNRDVHILIGLNKHTFAIHKDELTTGAIVVYDPKDYEWKQEEVGADHLLVPVPLTEIVTKEKADRVMRNTVALGASIALLGGSFDKLEYVINDQFADKKPAVAESNIRMAKAGYDYIAATYPSVDYAHLSAPKTTERLLNLNASEAVGMGAVRAGMRFAAIYPMTPINSLITFLAQYKKTIGLVYKQPEDEIAGIHMALGAAAAGVRSMVATSGGGFALMNEGLALAGIAELPIVLNIGMRVGPATGMPTWTEQGELLYVIHAGHGEFPRIVLAPGDGGEAYSLSLQAFHLAEKFQIPVFVLTDKYLAESHWCVPESVFTDSISIDRGKVVDEKTLPEDGSFRRYTIDSEDGVSPRSYFGMKNGAYIANSYEHDEHGFVTEDPQMRTRMAQKRLRKLQAIQKEITPPTVYGDENPDVTLLTWGSSKGPVLEAMRLLQSRGVRASVVHIRWVYPFPIKEVSQILTSAKRVVDIEQNATAQLAALVRMETGICIEETILKYDGRPFFP